jgi:ribosomal protein L24
MKEIKAAVLEKLNSPLQIRNIYSRPLIRGQVLVKIYYSGVCRSQLMEVNGNRGHDKWLPHLLGHEGSGVVVEVGEGVKKFKVGDQVKIITGDNKGTIGTIETILFKKSVLFIKEVAPRVKSIKNTTGNEAKKVEKPIPIHLSNVMLWDIETKSASKIGYKIVENKKYRYFKKSGKLIT